MVCLFLYSMHFFCLFLLILILIFSPHSPLLPVMLTSSAPRRTCHSCWSPSPTSSWHKALSNKDICTHAARHVVICSNVNFDKVSWCAVTLWWSCSFDWYDQNEIKHTFYFIGDLRVSSTRVTSTSHPRTSTCRLYRVYPICTVI